MKKKLSLTKNDIIEKVRDRFERAPKRYRYTKYHKYNPYFYYGLNKNKCKNCVNSLIEIMKETLEQREDILISGFGKFHVKGKKERTGRNPATGKSMQIKERRIVTFKASIKLREAIDNQNREKA